MKYVVNVYGRDVLCASCVNAPGSKETYEWLQAILDRKYPERDINYNYIDMDREENLTDYDQDIIERIDDDELFYPLVAINDEIVQDGHVQLKPIKRWFEEKGA
ncbi:YuzD family protein [Salinicoccus albus]|uniref:YuzD family protein n=1 Tax=Salinicoccus albus TaxID=418756 RepID=UPI00037E9965|nr:DUF1462 family protein [Salinicoccus albus]